MNEILTRSTNQALADSSEEQGQRKVFEYRFLVSFEETNVVGNVYFSNYFVWQGKCREAFLAAYAPQVLEDFAAGHGMITKESSCEFHNESFAFDNLLIRMTLDKINRTSITMNFQYFRDEEEPVLLATGRQSTIWASPGQKIAMLPDYLYDVVKKFAI
jgi:enediyne biosynthesis thioesterase